MFRASFGGAFTLTYYPHLNGTRINPPNQTPTIRIFSSLPTIANISDGTGSVVESISTWGETTSYQRTIACAAIADPGGTDKVKRYWVGLKYVAVSGGLATYDIEPFELARPEGLLLGITPTATELHSYDGNVEAYYQDNEVDSYLSVAVIKVKQALKHKRIDYGYIENVDDLKPAVIYRALTDLWSKQVQEEGDKFDKWRGENEANYKNEMESLSLQYDANKDDDVSTSEAETTTGQSHYSR